MTTFTPSPQEGNAHKIFRRSCAEAASQLGSRAITDPITRITMVGAMYIKTKGICSRVDLKYLDIVADLCRFWGIPISPDVRLTPLNIENDLQEDFLSPDLNLPTQLLMICNVPSLTVWHECPANSEEWFYAAKKSGASLIAAMKYTGEEIGKSHFHPVNKSADIYKDLRMPFNHPLRGHWEIDVLVLKELAQKIDAHAPREGAAFYHNLSKRKWAYYATRIY